MIAGTINVGGHLLEVYQGQGPSRFWPQGFGRQYYSLLGNPESGAVSYGNSFPSPGPFLPGVNIEPGGGPINLGGATNKRDERPNSANINEPSFFGLPDWEWVLIVLMVIFLFNY